MMSKTKQLIGSTNALVFKETTSGDIPYLTVEKKGKLTTDDVLKLVKECERRNRFVDLHGEDLFDLDLHGVYLPWADFSGATLKNVNFEGADLRNANFRGTTSIEVNFERTNLENASFWAAKRIGAKFKNAWLKGTEFAQVDLREVVGLEDAKGVTDLGLYDSAIVTSKQAELILKAVKERMRVILRIEA